MAHGVIQGIFGRALDKEHTRIVWIHAETLKSNSRSM